MTQPVPAGEPVTIQPSEQPGTPIGDAAQRDTTSPAQPEPGPGASTSSATPAATGPADAVAGQETRPVVGATSNESPRLPGNLTSGAARAHAALSTADQVTSNGDLSEADRLSALRRIIDFAVTELDRFLPAHVRGPAADEVGREL